MRHIAFIGIGSNLGDKINNCRSAIDRLGGIRENRILRSSSLYKTGPLGYSEQEWFVNGVVKVETTLEPPELLTCLKNLERMLGRTKTFLWGPRVIDLDVLLFNDTTFASQDLQIPHPRLHERAFVLVPLCEIDPQVVHPGLRKTAQKLLQDLGQVVGVERI